MLHLYHIVAPWMSQLHKQVLQDVAKSKGESINGYIKNAVQKQYKDDTGEEIEL